MLPRLTGCVCRRTLPLRSFIGRVLSIGTLLSIAIVTLACSRPEVALPEIRELAPTATEIATVVPEPAPTVAPATVAVSTVAVPTPTATPQSLSETGDPGDIADALEGVEAVGDAETTRMIVEEVHTRFMTELLVFDRGLDIELAAQLSTGAALSRLLDGIAQLRSPGYESAIVTSTEISPREYLVADCSLDLSEPTAQTRLRVARIVEDTELWRVAEFHTGGPRCTVPTP